jgi:hypothetical protein
MIKVSGGHPSARSGKKGQVKGGGAHFGQDGFYLTQKYVPLGSGSVTQLVDAAKEIGRWIHFDAVGWTRKACGLDKDCATAHEGVENNGPRRSVRPKECLYQLRRKLSTPRKEVGPRSLLNIEDRCR